ncbi:MAG: sigma factor-like helix-turn-helix DNA-binding protein [archaeon]
MLPKEARSRAGRKVKLPRNPHLLRARNFLNIPMSDVANAIGMPLTTYVHYETRGNSAPPEAQRKICQFFRDRGVFLFEADVFPEINASEYERKRFLKNRSVPDYACTSLTQTSLSALPSFDGNEEIFRAEESEMLERFIAELPERHAPMLRDYYGLEGNAALTYEEIGNKYGFSKQRAHVRVANALTDLARNYKSLETAELLSIMPEVRDLSMRRFFKDLVAVRQQN